MTSGAQAAVRTGGGKGSPLEVLSVFAKLGVSCFGGPIAHIGYFREEFVVRRHWLDEPAYADLVALRQFLPGPASSQVGFSLGLLRAGYLGGLAAWTGFTLPSAIALVLFAYGANAAFHSQEKPIIGATGIVDAVDINDAGFDKPTQASDIDQIILTPSTLQVGHDLRLRRLPHIDDSLPLEDGRRNQLSARHRQAPGR